MLFVILDTPTLYSGWKYNLNAVKDIKVTDDFMSLDEKDCSGETYGNCTTRTYVKKVENECGCLPFSMNFNESKVTGKFEILSVQTFVGQNLLS